MVIFTKVQKRQILIIKKRVEGHEKTNIGIRTGKKKIIINWILLLNGFFDEFSR